MRGSRSPQMLPKGASEGLLQTNHTIDRLPLLNECDVNFGSFWRSKERKNCCAQDTHLDGSSSSRWINGGWVGFCLPVGKGLVSGNSQLTNNRICKCNEAKNLFHVWIKQHHSLGTPFLGWILFYNFTLHFGYGLFSQFGHSISL
jgi:hypothetical protein